MRNPLLVVRGEDGPPGVLAHFEGRPQYERRRRLAVALREFGTRAFGVVMVSDRDTLSREVASIRAGSPDRDGQLGPGIRLIRRDLDRACMPTVRSDCLCRHGVDVIPETQEDRVGTISPSARSVAASGVESQAAGSWAAFVPAM